MAANAKAVPKVKMIFTEDYLHYKKDQKVQANKGMADYWGKIGVAKKQ